MYIIVAGAGTVGGSLAARLVESRHDVVVIERDRATCEEMTRRTGALAIQGVATDIDTLQEAGIARAEVAVAALPRDCDNLAFVVMARNYNVPRILARMKDTRYESAYKRAGVTRALEIGQLFVNQLVLEIELPTLREVATFGRGKASIVVVRLPEGTIAHGKTVQVIAQDRKFPQECVIAGVFRESSERFIFPRGPVELRAGDQVFLAAGTDDIRKAAEYLQKTD